MFNYRHLFSRIVIENAFELLKGRFRKLFYFENNNIMFIVKCVIVATILHNICIKLDDEVEYRYVNVTDDTDLFKITVQSVRVVQHHNF